MDPFIDNSTDINSDLTMCENYKSAKKKLIETDNVVEQSMDYVKNEEVLETTINDAQANSTKAPVNFEQTLPIGVAPDGFQIVDEVYSDNEKNEDNENKALITISFKNNDIAGQYKNKFMTFLNDLIIKKNKNYMVHWKELVLQVWGNVHNENADTTVDSSCTVASQGEFDSLFVVDTTPALKDDLNIPTYGKKYDKILDKNSSVQNENSQEKVLKLTCFNCMGKHNLKDCSEPRNQMNINKNRKDFNAKQIPRNLRYHQEDDQKYAHFIPGQLSNSLRQALNIKENDLPRHIYKMRQLGYPPGWLEEAKLHHSGLSLFNSKGIAEDDPDDEEGEIINLGNKDRYDITKIIDFPGFNVRAPGGTYEEYKQYWGSDMQIRNSKSSMLQELSDKKVNEGYKKKKLKKCNSLTSDSIIQASEMDIEILDQEVLIESVSVNGLFIPPLPKEDTRPPEPPQITLEDSDGQESLSPESTHEESTAPSSRADSPSLSDLEYAKKHILAELEDSSSQSNLENAAKNNNSLDISLSGTDMLPPGFDVTPQNKSQSKIFTPTSTRGISKSIDLGTPILKSASPFSKLPSSEKFSKDICDVIYFENLPDATGKFEQMTGLIQKVRNRLAEINKE